jgi:leucyl-tRNA synthetase
MMELVNLLVREGGTMPRALADGFLLMLSPFAPHITEELNARLHGGGSGAGARSLAWQPWPEVDAAELVDDDVEIAVQVNGKVRAALRVPRAADAAALEAAARAEPAVRALLEGAQVAKVIAVPGRIVNFVLSRT